MITNKDVRVENGNIVLNGDKFPLDGQSPEAIIAIIEAACDTTPTENSTAPITSGGVFAADKDITDTIGDITQSGVTGATVAAQIGKLADDIISEVKETTDITAIAAGNYGFYNIDCSKNGYTPIGIGEIYYAGDNGLILCRYTLSGSGVASIIYYNVSAASVTPTKLTLKVIYKKS